MACGRPVEVVESYWTSCYYSLTYPCGIKWCKKWGIYYPCGFNYCTVSIPYPCLRTRRKTKYCYDFTVVHNNCKVLYEKHYGCCDGREYEWSDACLGWFDAYLPGPINKCFDEPLEDLGSCREGKSLPPGGEIPGGNWVPDDQVSVGGPRVQSALLVAGGIATTIIGFIGFLNEHLSLAQFALIFLIGQVVVLLGPIFYFAHKKRGQIIYLPKIMEKDKHGSG